MGKITQSKLFRLRSEVVEVIDLETGTLIWWMVPPVQ